MKERDGASGTRRLRRAIGARLSYANVTATLALLIAMATGGAYAAELIGPKDIAKNAVRAKHIKKNQVRAKHIKKRQVKAKHVARNAIRTSMIRDGAVTAVKLAEDVQGLSGAAGPAGPKGDQGEPGAPGAAGADGADGASSWSADCNEGLAPGDVMVRVGSVCIDRYEASLWDARTGGSQITGAIPCLENGQNCTNIYARSVAGVEPVDDITWFQAQQALINSGKRLPTSAEWQGAVAGTPDGTGCNVSGGSIAHTGANAFCVSNHGAYDMVGNLFEMVADWDEEAIDCASWPAGYGNDLTCLGRGSGESSTRFPGVVMRGGSFRNGTQAGPFAVAATLRPFDLGEIGFRGAR